MQDIYTTEQIIEIIKQVKTINELDLEYARELHTLIEEGAEIDKAISAIEDPKERERAIIEIFSQRKRNFK